jgi:hypothetical protein
MLCCLQDCKASSVGARVQRDDLHKAVRDAFPGKAGASKETTDGCNRLLTMMSSSVASAGHKQLLDVVCRKPLTYSLTPDGEEAAKACAAPGGGNDAASSSKYADGAGDPIFQVNVAALAAAQAQLDAAQVAESALSNIIANVQATMEELRTADAAAKQRTTQCEAAASKLDKKSTAALLVAELMPQVKAIAMPNVLSQAGWYRLFVQNCGACSGGGRGTFDALLTTVVELVCVSGAALAVLIEVPENGVAALQALRANMDTNPARWQLATSTVQGTDRQECVAFLWDSARFSSNGEGTAVTPGADADGGRAPAACHFKPVNDCDKLDITIYG